MGLNKNILASDLLRIKKHCLGKYCRECAIREPCDHIPKTFQNLRAKQINEKKALAVVVAIAILNGKGKK